MTFFSDNALAENDRISLKVGQPKDVRQLIDRIADCHHFAGEEPYDAERAKELAAAIAKLKCSEIGKIESALRKRYAAKPAVIEALDRAHVTYY